MKMTRFEDNALCTCISASCVFRRQDLPAVLIRIYPMTIRRAQGATLDQVVLYFDHMFPCDRGCPMWGPVASEMPQDCGISAA